jgi:hypothetical protein
VLRGQVGLLADEDSVRRRGGLNAGRRVEHVPGGRPFALARARAEHHERLTGMDPDADVQVEPLVLGIQLRDRPLDREPGANGTLGVVLVGFRRAEERQDGVAAELFERAAVPLELSPHTRVVRGDERLDVLGVELLGAGGRADEVDEDRRDDLSFLARRRGSGRAGQRRAAGQAKAGLYGVFRTAFDAKRHRRRVRRRLDPF